ncbi:MAG: 3-methyl-2-oxobutanoate dehydrogenase subunit VorB, partial [Coriobacteriia bacterium]|nr:3-methyl-2-oxobutanoate dehydrogenase subunit VorB [Coriobacteriia bacterium]
MGEKVLMKGNEALAEAAIRAGCHMYYGYPITPQSEVAAYMSAHLPPIGGTFIQAESEIAAVNMLYGASAAGARAMTASSSPGISLKGEGISYMLAGDLPGLIVNINRCGPGLGGIQPAQGDYWMATRATGHGDGHVFVFAPYTVQEMADLTRKALEMSDQYRIPAMILADGLLGQMMEPVELPEHIALEDLPPKPWAVTGMRGKREKNIVNTLYLQAQALEDKILERKERYALIKESEQMAQLEQTEDAQLIVVAYGASARIARSAVNMARAEGLKVGLMRPITLWPFITKAIDEACATASAFLTVELNTGQ